MQRWALTSKLKGTETINLVKVKYDPRKFSTIDKGIEAYLKELLARFYEEKDKRYGKQVWRAFVKEGGLQKFIDTAKVEKTVKMPPSERGKMTP